MKKSDLFRLFIEKRERSLFIKKLTFSNKQIKICYDSWGGGVHLGWMYVFWAAVVEVFWVIGLKYSDSMLDWIGTTIAIIFSFYFIIKACEKLPSGTVYAVFTGSGAAVIVFIDYYVFNAELSWQQFFFIALIIIGVVGLKHTTLEEKAEGKGED